MKKVLYISYDGMTDPLGQSQVLPYMVGLSKMGYEFTLLSFEKKERFSKSAALIKSICKDNNIRWVHEFFSSQPPLLSKMYDSWKMKRKAGQLHKEYQFDFTHCRSYVAASAGLHLFKKHKLPFLFDMRGFWVDERVDNGQWNLKNPVYKAAYSLYKGKERKYFKEAGHIISLTEKGKEELVNSYAVEEKRISVIPCCADLYHFDYTRISRIEMEQTRKKLGINNEDKVLSYLGSLGGWYLTDEMLDFFKIASSYQQGVKFLFITHDKKDGIIDRAASRGIEPGKIIVTPATRQQVPGYLAISNWSIFFIKDAYSKKASSPTKQGEIMAMGIPIVCNDIGDTGRIIEESGTGLVIRDFSDKSYATVAKRLGDLERLDKNMIRDAAFNYYDLTKGVMTYSNVYNEMGK